MSTEENLSQPVEGNGVGAGRGAGDVTGGADQPVVVPETAGAGSKRKFGMFEWVAMGVLVLLVVGLAIAAVLELTGRSEVLDTMSTHVKTASSYSYLHQREYGSPDAKVRIVAAIPLGKLCHPGTTEYMARQAEQCQEQCHWYFVDYNTPEGEKLVADAGLKKCASILINGKNAFVDPDDDQFQIEFSGPPESYTYSVEDLRTILQQELNSAYGVFGSYKLPKTGAKPAKRLKPGETPPPPPPTPSPAT